MLPGTEFRTISGTRSGTDAWWTSNQTFSREADLKRGRNLSFRFLYKSEWWRGDVRWRESPSQRVHGSIYCMCVCVHVCTGAGTGKDRSPSEARHVSSQLVSCLQSNDLLITFLSPRVQQTSAITNQSTHSHSHWPEWLILIKVKSLFKTASGSFKLVLKYTLSCPCWQIPGTRSVLASCQESRDHRERKWWEQVGRWGSGDRASDSTAPLHACTQSARCTAQHSSDKTNTQSSV